MLNLACRHTAPACAAGLLLLSATSSLAAPSLAAPRPSDTDLRRASGVDAPPLADAQLDGDRGGAGLLGLPDGSFTFAQIGDQTQSGSQTGSPGASTTVFALGGSSLSGFASLSAGGDFSFVSGSNWSQTLSAMTSHSFTP